MGNYKILISGGCGFIGRSLIKNLLPDDQVRTIRILDNFSTGTPDDLASVTPFIRSAPQDCKDMDGIVLVEGDIQNAESVMHCAVDVNCIVHLAANTGVGPSVENPRNDLNANVIGTFNMLEAARLNGIEKFVFASSGAPAGEVEPPIHEEIAPHPVSPYGASKLAGEGYCSAYFKTFGIQTVCLRFGNVYGPLSQKKSSVVAKFIKNVLNDEICEIYGDGSQTRDFLYIDDLVRAVKLAMVQEVGGETFQIASGMERTIGEVTTLLEKAFERRGLQMNLKHGHARVGDVKRNFSDTTKAKIILGWKPIVKLEDGIEKTIDYFLNEC